LGSPKKLVDAHVYLGHAQTALPKPGRVPDPREHPHQVAATLKGHHLLLEEGGNNMAGCEALTRQLQDVLHGGVQFTTARVGLLPVGLAGQQALGSTKRDRLW
jgi:hypothetical protein